MPEEPQLGDWRGFQDYLKRETEGKGLNITRTIPSGLHPSPDAKYDEGYMPGMNLNRLRQSNQTGWDVFSNALENVITTIPLEAAEGVGSLISQAFEDDTNEFLEGQNAFSTKMRELKESAQADSPIYAKEGDQMFDPFNAMSWATNAPSIASTFSMMIPAMGIGRLASGAAGTAAKLVGAGAKGTQAAKAIAATGAAATSSRYMENLLEGYGTFQEALTAGLIESGISAERAPGMTESLLKDPEATMKGPYKDQFLGAADAASKTMQWNWGAAIPDALQYALVYGGVKLPKFGASKVPGASTKLAATGRFSGVTLDKLKNAGANMATQAASEGAEEAYQYIVSKEALNSGEMFGGNFQERLNDYLAEEELWSSALMGAVMGAGFTAGGSAIKKVQDRVSAKLINASTAKKLSNYTYESDLRDSMLVGNIRQAYLQNGSLDKVINKISTEAEKQDPANQTELSKDLLGTVQELNLYAKELEAQGYSTEQVADKIAMDMVTTLKGYSKKRNLQEFNNHIKNAVDRNMISEEQMKGFEAKAKMRVISKILKKYPESQSAKFTTQTKKFLAGLKEELITLTKESEGYPKDIPEPRQARKAEEAYTAYLFDSLMQEESRAMGAKALVNDPEFIAQKEASKEKAAKKASEEAAKSVHTAKSVEDIQAAKKEEEALSGSTKKTETEIKKAASKNEPKWEDITSKDGTALNQLAKRIETAYTEGEKYAAFDRDRAALSEIFGQELPLEVAAFAKRIAALYKSSENNAKIITSFYKKTLERPTQPTKVSSKSNTAPTGRETAPKHDATSYEKVFSDVKVVGAQWLWGERDQYGRKQPRYNDAGYYAESRQRYPDDPIIDYSKIDRVDFAPQSTRVDGEVIPGWSATIKIDPNREWNKKESDLAMEVWATNPENGEQVFLGHLQRTNNSNASKTVLDLRKYIEEQYNASGKTEVFTAPLNLQVKDKLKGDVYNRDAAKHPEFWVTPKEALKDKPLQLVTVLIDPDGSATWGGLDSLPDDVANEIRTFNINKHGRNEYGRHVGGYMYMVVEGTNGKPMTVQVFTKFLEEVPLEQQGIHQLVDELYKDYSLTIKQSLVENLSALLHVNNRSSNRKVVFDEEANPMWMEKNEEGEWKEAERITAEDLKEKLNKTIFYLDSTILNTEGVNDRYNEYLRTDMNPDMPVHSTSFTIEAITVTEEVEPADITEATPVEGDQGISIEALLNKSEVKNTPASEDIPESTPDTFLNLNVNKSESHRNNPKPMSAKGETMDIGDVAVEKENVSKVLGSSAAVKEFEKETGLPMTPEVVTMLTNLKRKGEVLQGMFTRAGLYLRTHGTVGRGYHEAFHAVFTLALTPGQQALLLDETRTKLGKELTDLEVEEYLAEEFRKESLLRDSATLTQRAKDTLMGLWAMIKGFFNPSSKINQRTLFRDMYFGKYSGKVKFQRDLSSFMDIKTMVDPDGTNVPYVSNLAMMEFEEVFQEEYHALIEALKNSNLGNPNSDKGILSDAELIQRAAGKGSPVQYLKNKLAQGLINRYQELHANGSDVSTYGAILASYYPRIISNPSEDVDTSKYNLVITNGEVEVKKGSAVQTQALLNLRKFGLHINLSKNDFMVRTDEEVDVLNEVEDKNHEREGFNRNRGQEDNREKVRDFLKRQLSRIPKYSLDGEVTFNQFGVARVEDPANVMSNLELELSNSIDTEDMMSKLNNLAKKHMWARDVRNLATNSPEFKKGLWLGIGGMWLINYFGVTGRGNTYLSNRRNALNYISKNIASTFLNPANPLLTKGSYNINRDNVNKLLQSIEEIRIPLSRVKGTAEYTMDNNGNKVTVTSLLDRLGKLLQDHYINIDAETLAALYKEGTHQEFMQKIFIPRDPQTGKINKQNSLGKGLEAFIVNMSNTGNNPFLDYESIDSNQKLVRNLGNLLRSAWPNKVQQVFMNINSERTFALTEPTYLSQKIQQMKAGLLNMNIGFLEAAPILQDLKSDAFRKALDLQVLDGAEINGQRKGYKSLTKLELAKVMIDGFRNRNQKTALIPIPIPADSSMLPFIQYPKLDTAAALNKLYQVAQMEKKRINNYEANKSLGLEDLKFYGEKAGSFQYLKFLNKPEYKNLDFDNPAMQGAVKAAIEKELKEEIELTYKELADKYTYKSKQGNILPAYDDQLVTQYVYNFAYYQSQTIALLSKDPSFYKSIGDAFKRYKQLGAPGMTPADYANRKVKTVVIADTEIENDDNISTILELAYQDSTTQSLHKEKNNITDGFTFVSPSFYRDFADSVGKWTRKQEETYQRWLVEVSGSLPEGAKPLRSKDLRDLFPPIKPYYFSEYEHGGELVPIQMKNSIHALHPDFVAMNPNSTKLAKAWEMMESGIDIVTFDSTIKVGAFKTSDEVRENYSGPYKTLTDIEAGGVEGAIIEINMKDLRWQQDNPPHWFEYVIKLGSQLRTLLPSGVKSDTIYNLDGIELTGEEVLDLYNSLIESIYAEQLANLQEGVDLEKGEIGPLVDQIVSMAYDRNAPNTDIQSLNETIENGQGYRIPNLFGSGISDLSRSLVSSLHRKKVWTQEMPGGQFVNVSSFGVSENLNYEVTPEGVINMEVYLPAWTKALLIESEKDGGKIDPKVLELVGYRIPTEGKYSIFNMKVKGFLPQSNGGSIIMPKEITKIAGLDFDVDKLFVFTPNHSYNKDTQTVEAESFDLTKNETGFNLNQPIKARQNAFIRVIRAIMQNKAHAAEALGPGNFADLKSLTHSFFLRDRARVNPKEFGKYKNMSLAQLKALPGKQDIVNKIENSEYNAIYPRTQQEFHERNATGEALIGVTANHRTHAVKSERTNLQLAAPITLDGLELQRLNLYEGYHGLIGKNLEQFSAAMVDNAKDPTAPFVNFNVHTADIAMTMIRLGLSIDYTLSFLTHPTVVATVNKAFDENISLAKAIRLRYKELTNDLPTGIVTDISLKELFEDTNDSNLEVLNNLLELQQTGAELSRLISATKTDATPAASNSGKLWTQKNNIEDVINNNFNKLLNTSDFFDPTKAKLTWAAYEYGHKPVWEMYNHLFPYLETSFDDVKKAMKSRIPSYSQLSAEEATNIDNHLISFHLSMHPLISGIKNRKAFIQDVYARVRDYKKNMNPKYALLLGQLELVAKETNNNDVDRIEYNRTSLGDETLDNLRGLFLSMYQEGSAAEKALAKDLIRYALVTAQEQSTPFTFFSLIHPLLLRGEASINDHKSKLIKYDYNFLATDFVNQYFRNNVRSPLIPTIPKSKAKFGKNTNNGVLLVDKKEFSVGSFSDPDYYSNPDRMVPYVKVPTGRNEYALYEYQPTNGKDVAWYTKVDQLGIPNFAFEYYPSDINPVSTFKDVETVKEEEIPNTQGDMEQIYNSGGDQEIINHPDLMEIYDLNPKFFKDSGINSKEDINKLTEEEAGELYKKYCNNL